MISRRAIDLKKKLAAGGFGCGIWVSLPTPSATEVIVDAGFDWIVVDSEHAVFNLETLQVVLMAFRGTDTVPIVRVPWNDHVIIKQMLDMGWEGIVTPQTNSAEEARRAVAACRYPPLGTRGYGPRRASNYYKNQEEYVSLANDSVICAIQVEHIAGAEQIDEIVAVPGIDWILLGPCDMSGSLGRLRDLDNPELWKGIHKILDAAHAAGIPTGNPLGTFKDIEDTLALGCQLVVLGDDTTFLREAAENAVSVFNHAIKSRKK